MAIISKIISGKKYFYEKTYKNGKQKWKCLGHINEDGTFIPSKEMRDKNPEDFPAEIQQIIKKKELESVTIDEEVKEIIESEIVPAKPLKPEGKNFVLMRNGKATNELMKTPSKTKLQDSFDPLTGIVKYQRDDFWVIFENFAAIKGLRNSTKKLLDALTIKFTEGSGKKPIVNLSLAQYMKMRGLSDKKEARKQAEEDLETLSNVKLTFSQEMKHEAKNFVNLKIIGTHGIKNSIISAAFDVAFHALILNYQPMPIPLAFLALNDKRSPNAYPLGRRIIVHKNINRVNKTGNEDIISVQTLLEACLDIPTKEELERKDRTYKDKMIKPFEDSMNALEETGVFSWEYCHSKGEPLTDNELENLNYEIFINLLVKITWNDYPALPTKEKPLRKSKPQNKNT